MVGVVSCAGLFSWCARRSERLVVLIACGGFTEGGVGWERPHL